MLFLSNLYGSIECTNDSADYAIDGQSSRRVIVVRGTGSGLLIIRALTFLYGQGDTDRGPIIWNGAIVEINLCLFSNCRATDSHDGGGAIFSSK